MPKLQTASWQVYRKSTTGTGSVGVPTMLLNLTLCQSDAPRDVQVEMSKEQLDEMIASLKKIKEQVLPACPRPPNETCVDGVCYALRWQLDRV